MATISISIGQLTVARTVADDAKAGLAIKEFFLDQGLGPPDSTNRQVVEAVLVWFVRQISAKAAQRHIQNKRGEAEIEAKNLYDLELPPVGP